MLDLLDNLLNKGVMLNGDITLGVAGIDLIYLRLSTLLCAADRIFGESDQRGHRAGTARRAPGGRARSSGAREKSRKSARSREAEQAPAERGARPWRRHR